ncbi:hypothetical protein OIB37_34860 [Streptomyces sp. NBC_00820]|uniref:hypothetical protein n=1 Tax=Streptomyces sp. NBC_00820 TaxID=2975842 RepID=UPI002ED629B7|nr:hypothetical protein OIB37_34860 [Streptomyces sp. NBC_00820]
MSTPHTAPRAVAPRAAAAAATGAVLAYGAVQFLAWTTHNRERACRDSDTMCFTGWDVAFLPIAFATALLVLLPVYKRLEIGPRIVAIPLTILLAPFPLQAAYTTGGPWLSALSGGVLSCSIALSSWNRSRSLGVTAAIVLLAASFGVLYH